MADELVKIRFIKCGMLPGRKHWTDKEMPEGAIVEVEKAVAESAIKKGVAKEEKKRKPMDKVEIAELRAERAERLFKEKMEKIEAIKKLLEG